MFFKELACLYCLVINVHFVCLSVPCVSNSFILSCVAFLVNNFFQLFLISFLLFQRRLLKLISIFVDLLLPCSATLDTIHPTPDKSQQYFSNFFRNGKINKIHNFFLRNCGFCTNTIYLIIQYQLLLWQLFLLYQ